MKLHYLANFSISLSTKFEACDGLTFKQLGSPRSSRFACHKSLTRRQSCGMHLVGVNFISMEPFMHVDMKNGIKSKILS